MRRSGLNTRNHPFRPIRNQSCAARYAKILSAPFNSSWLLPLLRTSAREKGWRMGRIVQLNLTVIATLLICGCGGGASSNSSSGSGGTVMTTTTVPQFAHVVLIVEENEGYSDVMGSSSMPYFNQLAAQYSVAANYFSNAHPSLPNY